MQFNAPGQPAAAEETAVFVVNIPANVQPGQTFTIDHLSQRYQVVAPNPPTAHGTVQVRLPAIPNYESAPPDQHAQDQQAQQLQAYLLSMQAHQSRTAQQQYQEQPQSTPAQQQEAQQMQQQYAQQMQAQQMQAQQLQAQQMQQLQQQQQYQLQVQLQQRQMQYMQQQLHLEQQRSQAPPPAWVTQQDPMSGRTYLVNSRTGEVQWQAK